METKANASYAVVTGYPEDQLKESVRQARNSHRPSARVFAGCGLLL